jgi:hypothetical protein
MIMKLHRPLSNSFDPHQRPGAPLWDRPHVGPVERSFFPWELAKRLNRKAMGMDGAIAEAHKHVAAISALKDHLIAIPGVDPQIVTMKGHADLVEYL